MEHDERADQIRERMAELRSDLSCDVEQVGRSARAMTDVGLYVRRFPWATVATAMAVGYMLVPKRKQIVYPDPTALARLIEQKQLRVETKPSDNSPKAVLKSLLVMGLMTAARTGMNSIVERLASAARAPERESEFSPTPHEPLRTD